MVEAFYGNSDTMPVPAVALSPPERGVVVAIYEEIFRATDAADIQGVLEILKALITRTVESGLVEDE